MATLAQAIKEKQFQNPKKVDDQSWW
jgi:hypothetical protein